MAFFDEAFDVDSIPEPEKRDFEPIPAGWYTATIAGAEVKTTKAGTGEYIAVRFDITGPQHQGRVVFTNLNVRNPNETAERIGREQLGNIMLACGIKKLPNCEMLVGGSLSIKVVVKNDPTYGASNEVKGIKALDGAMPTVPPSSMAAPAAISNSAASPPWAK